MDQVSKQLAQLQTSVDALASSVDHVSDQISALQDMVELNNMTDRWRQRYQELDPHRANIAGLFSRYQQLVQNAETVTAVQLENWAESVVAELFPALETFDQITTGQAGMSDELAGLFDQWTGLLWRQICEGAEASFFGPVYDPMETHFLGLMAPQISALIMLAEAKNYYDPTGTQAASVFVEYRQRMRRQSNLFAHTVGRMAIYIQQLWWRQDYDHAFSVNIPEFFLPNPNPDDMNAFGFEPPEAIARAEEAIRGVLG